jgi:hypothetical protein
MREKICGYMVVRKPEYAKTGVLTPRPWIGPKTYRGLDRVPWEDLEIAWFDRRRRASILPLWQELDRLNRDLSGIRVFKNLRHAQEVLELASEKSEIIAIWSRELEEIKGAGPAEADLTLLGLDCMAIGEWSVVLGGIYAEPDHFAPFVERLNAQGLLSSEEDCEALFQSYVALSENDIVEPLAANAVPMSVRIFAL